MRASVAVLLASSALALLPFSARADDSHLVLMGESTTFTDTADAADDNDPFDLNLTAQFVRTMSGGGIQREVADPTVGPGAIHYVDIANASQTTNVLQLGIEVGLWHDLHLYSRLPITLSDDRDLKQVSTLTNAVGDALPWGTASTTGVGNHSFRSPTRSGLDQLVLGVGWGISNQYRNPAWPTWVLLVEAHINVGNALHPCSATALPDGMGGMESGGCRALYTADGMAKWDNNAGSSRGWNGVRIETRVSRRFRYFEPYTSIAFGVEFPDSSGALFASSGNLAGMERTIPPIMGEANFGVAVIPWENRAKYQRFTLDFRGTFSYISEGLDYSPLYDALGTSHDPELTAPSCENAGPCDPMDRGSLKNWFYGITDVQQHVRLGGRVNIEMQAAKYLRFGVGAGLYWTSPYIATFSDACNPNFVAADPATDPRVGNCNGGTIHNPTYRDTIDLASRRFRVDGWVAFDLMASVTAMF